MHKFEIPRPFILDTDAVGTYLLDKNGHHYMAEVRRWHGPYGAVVVAMREDLPNIYDTGKQEETVQLFTVEEWWEKLKTYNLWHLQKDRGGVFTESSAMNPTKMLRIENEVRDKQFLDIPTVMGPFTQPADCVGVIEFERDGQFYRAIVVEEGNDDDNSISVQQSKWEPTAISENGIPQGRWSPPWNDAGLPYSPEELWKALKRVNNWRWSFDGVAFSRPHNSHDMAALELGTQTIRQSHWQAPLTRQPTLPTLPQFSFQDWLGD